MRPFLLGFVCIVMSYVFAPPATADHEWNQVINSSARFRVLNDFGRAAVLDRETDLVWERSPDTGVRDWLEAQAHCNSRVVGSRFGWRLPTIQELASLLDPENNLSRETPTIPTDHPFENVLTTLPNGQTPFYWSATTSLSRGDCTDCVWAVNFQETDETNLDIIGKDNRDLAWCVRGVAGHGADSQ